MTSFNRLCTVSGTDHWKLVQIMAKKLTVDVLIRMALISDEVMIDV